MKLTDENYYSKTANEAYFSASQFKSFLACEARAMAELDGDYERTPSKSMLIGSYVDAHFSGEMNDFIYDHPEIFNRRTGELKKDFVKADEIIARAERDPVFSEALSGEHQTIMTANLFGAPFKIKMDSYFPNERIVDLKVMRDMKKTYKDGEWKTFVDAWQFDIQGFIYQQVVKENTGKELPFYLAVITKEEHPDLALIHIPQWKLNSAGEIVKHYIDRFVDVKCCEVEPKRCGECDYCRDTKTLSGAIEYEDLVGEDL